MTFDVVITINAVTLLALAGSFVKVSALITRVVAIQEIHDQRITRLEKRVDRI